MFLRIFMNLKKLHFDDKMLLLVRYTTDSTFFIKRTQRMKNILISRNIKTQGKENFTVERMCSIHILSFLFFLFIASISLNLFPS